MKGYIVLALLMMTQGIFVSAGPTMAGQFSAGHECIPGNAWMEDCNHCFCTDKGLKMCTLMACPNGIVDFRLDSDWDYKNDLSCTPGSSFKNDCNWCVCSADGEHAACTLMAC